MSAVCYSARLENVSSVHGATRSGKSSELSTERSCKHTARDATLAATFLGHCWVLAKWQRVSSGSICPSLCHLPQPLGVDFRGTTVCIWRQFIPAAAALVGCLYGCAFPSPPLLLRSSAPALLLPISLAILGLRRESEAGWGRSSAACKGACRKATADPKTSFCFWNGSAFFQPFWLTSPPLPPPLGISAKAAQDFACISGGPRTSSGATCASLYI